MACSVGWQQEGPDSTRKAVGAWGRAAAGRQLAAHSCRPGESEQMPPSARQPRRSLAGTPRVIHSSLSFIRKFLGPVLCARDRAVCRTQMWPSQAARVRETARTRVHRQSEVLPRSGSGDGSGMTGTTWAEGHVLLGEGVPPAPSPGGGGAGLPRAPPAVWGSSLGVPARLAQNALQGGPQWGAGVC